MLKWGVFFVFVALLGGVTMRASLAEAPVAKNDSWSYLAKWEGHLPSDKLVVTPGTKAQRLWDDPSLLSVIKKKVPAEVVDSLVNGWPGETSAVLSPIERQGDILFVTTCRPHSCAFDSVFVFIDMKKRDAQFCITQWSDKMKGSTDIWVGQKVRRLGPQACQRGKPFNLYKYYSNVSG